MSRKWLALFFAGVIGLLSFAALPVSGQDTTITTSQAWTAPKFLGDGWWQSLTLDQQDTLHVAWYGSYDAGDKAGHDVLTYMQRSSTGVWSGPSDVVYTGDGGFTVRNALAVTSDGILHAAFRGNVNHYIASAPAIGAMSATNWTAPEQLGDVGYY